MYENADDNGVLGIFSEEPIEREHHRSKLAAHNTNVGDFRAKQTQIEKRRHKGLDPGASKISEEIEQRRKRNRN